MARTAAASMKEGPRRSRQAGFSMLDVFVSLAVVGVLAAVAAVTFEDYTQQARFENVLSAVRQQVVEIEVEYRETGVMPVMSRIRPHDHPEINRITFTRRNDHRLFVKVRVEKDLYTSSRNRQPEIWYLAEGDGEELVTWSCGSSPRANRAIPDEKLPSYCRDSIPRR